MVTLLPNNPVFSAKEPWAGAWCLSKFLDWLFQLGHWTGGEPLMIHQSNMLSLTKLFHSTLGQISAVISYNAVGKTKVKNHLFNELNRRCHVTLTDRLCFNPLCKFVNRHQKVGLLSLDLLKGPTIASPQTANGQVIGIILNSWADTWTHRENFWQPSHLLTRSSASAWVINQ